MTAHSPVLKTNPQKE